MKNLISTCFLTLSLIFLNQQTLNAQELSADQKAAIKKQFEILKTWAADKTIVDAVKKANESPEHKDMTQEKWAAATVLDPVVKSLIKNAVGEKLKSFKNEIVSEAFVSAADGTKVGFLSKTSGWSHKGKAKHDDPMANKEWTGKVEVDESTGAQQIQIAVPVLDGKKPIGSLVVGLSVAKLK